MNGTLVFRISEEQLEKFKKLASFYGLSITEAMLLLVNNSLASNSLPVENMNQGADESSLGIAFYSFVTSKGVNVARYNVPGNKSGRYFILNNSLFVNLTTRTLRKDHAKVIEFRWPLYADMVSLCKKVGLPGAYAIAWRWEGSTIYNLGIIPLNMFSVANGSYSQRLMQTFLNVQTNVGIISRLRVREGDIPIIKSVTESCLKSIR